MKAIGYGRSFIKQPRQSLKVLTLLAVANKLLKQSLAIAKSGLYYDEDFKSAYINIEYRGLDFCTVHCYELFRLFRILIIRLYIISDIVHMFPPLVFTN